MVIRGFRQRVAEQHQATLGGRPGDFERAIDGIRARVTERDDLTVWLCQYG